MRRLLLIEQEPLVVFGAQGPTGAPPGKTWEVRCDRCKHHGVDAFGREQERTCARLAERNVELGRTDRFSTSYIFTPPDFGCSLFEAASP